MLKKSLPGPIGETNTAALATLADERLRATPEQLCDALGACTELNVQFADLLVDQSQLLQRHLQQPPVDDDMEMASLLSQHQDAVEGLAEVPGLGVDAYRSPWKISGIADVPRKVLLRSSRA